MYNISSITDSLSNSNITSLVNNVNKISNNLNSGTGSLSKLMNDEKLYDNFEKSTSELAELIEDIKNNPKRYVNFSLLGSGAKNFKKNQDN